MSRISQTCISCDNRQLRVKKHWRKRFVAMSNMRRQRYVVVACCCSRPRAFTIHGAFSSKVTPKISIRIRTCRRIRMGQAPPVTSWIHPDIGRQRVVARYWTIRDGVGTLLNRKHSNFCYLDICVHRRNVHV